MAITDGVYGPVGGSSSKNQHGATTAEISKSQSQVDDTWGARLRAGGGQHNYGEVDASYRSSYGQVSGSVIQNRTITLATAQFDGSIAMIGGGVFSGNKVDSAFAAVDAGASGVTVTQDNRVIGKTNFMGKMLVPNLRPSLPNRVGIDPEGQPVSYDAAKVAEVTAPRGKPLQAGFKGNLECQNDIFLVGHDGRAYVKDLATSNVAIIDLLDRECRASFAFTPEPGCQRIVRGVLCQ